jgi:Lon protease-like protein
MESVPLFPLPNVVLLPRAILPLHIFEERYKTMTADALRGRRQIAMALLRPGWEKSYYGSPEIEPVVCIGAILSHERLPDGKYNFLLQGQQRAKVVSEIGGDLPYRVAQLQPLLETKILEIDLSAARQRLEAFFASARSAGIGIARQFRHMLSSPLATADIADLIAFNLLEDVELKQSLLADTDVRKRVETIVSAVEALRPPPVLSGVGDPSMN